MIDQNFYFKVAAVNDWIHDRAKEMLVEKIFTTTSTTTTTTTTPLGPLPLSSLGLATYECEPLMDQTRGDFRIMGGSTNQHIIQSWPWMGNLNAECGAVLIDKGSYNMSKLTVL